MRSRDFLNLPPIINCEKPGNIMLGTSYMECETSRILAEGSGRIRVEPNTKLYNCNILAEDGADVYIGFDCDLADMAIFCRKGSSVIIGNYVECHGDLWGRNTIHSRDGRTVSIGNNCLLSGNILIRNNDGHPIVDEDGVQVNESQDVKIGDYNWICEGARILKGVQTGSNVIIGNSAVVTKSTMDRIACEGNTERSNVVIAGNPARKAKDLPDGTVWEK